MLRDFTLSLRGQRQLVYLLYLKSAMEHENSL